MHDSNLAAEKTGGFSVVSWYVIVVHTRFALAKWFHESTLLVLSYGTG